jgi:hypothetical protein
MFLVSTSHVTGSMKLIDLRLQTLFLLLSVPFSYPSQGK